MAPTPVCYADRPELWDRLATMFAGVWPEYALHGDVMEVHWSHLFETYPEFQFVLCDEHDDIVGAGRTIPCHWDGTIEGLGSGLDAVIVAGLSRHHADSVPNTLCALGAEIPPRHQGKRLSRVLLKEMAELARSTGYEHLIVPVRPTLKEHYPLTSMHRYSTWTREDGSPFDPWIRAHVEFGGAIAKPIPMSSRITGTVSEWESWTAMSFPDDGDYVFPGGLTTLQIDHEHDLGSYWEPNVWVTHSVRGAPIVRR